MPRELGRDCSARDGFGLWGTRLGAWGFWRMRARGGRKVIGMAGLMVDKGIGMRSG
jgi:hypothetical protein